MSEVAIDFGTSNTVLARYNETLERAETIRIPDVAGELRYRLQPGGAEHSVWVIPSVIHFGEKETLVGDQVIGRGLADHPDTMRWMKRSIAQNVTRRRKTAQGHKSPAEAGEEFLKLVLNYAEAEKAISLASDTFTFTVPVEAFENFQDWIWRVAESLGIQKLRILDEPTACVFGYHGAARQDERFAVFDFGGGTLDVSAVRLDLLEQSGRKAVQLGQAGCDLGGMDIDKWLAEAFCAANGVDERDARALENAILRQAEAAKIALSDPEATDAEMSVLDNLGRVPRLLQTTWRRACATCEPGAAKLPAGDHCLGCLLVRKGFPRQIEETLNRALENAAIKAGLRRSELTRVLVTGGTSLVPAVRRILDAAFPGKVEYDHPFDCVVRGACRGIVTPMLQHDYAIESYDRERQRFEFKPLFKIGTEFPTAAEAVRFWCNGSSDGQTRVGLQIFEVSRMKRRAVDQAMVDAEGRIQAARVTTDFEHICLNGDNPTFIAADPPIHRERDKQRFLCAFEIDGNRRLLVTATDILNGKRVLEKHPVVRL